MIEYGGNVNGSADWSIVTDMTTNFATFNAGLNSIAANHGNPESGSSAGLFGLNNITWTADSVKNIILVTDEDDDSDGQGNIAPLCSARVECNAFDLSLTANDALFNVIRNPGAGNTVRTYDYLAAQHGGTAFDINAFRAAPMPFFDNFINTKVTEIITKAPEPSTIALIGLGLIGLGIRRRRIK